MDDLEARRRDYLRLCLAEGVGPVTVRRLLERFGSVRAAVAAGPGAWREAPGVGDATAAALAAVDERAIDAELALAAEHGAAVLCLDDPSYPPALRHLPGAPPVLYVLGELVEADAVAVAIVGARRCSTYGLEQSRRFGELLGRAGLTVVSGGARGIDAAAHRGALRAGGRTVAVMGCGLSRLYPPDNAKLFRQILDAGRGAVVSELPMRIGVKPRNFPTRNRIISGLSLGVLVIEAARRSGSLITARLALEQGKDVFAVPGRVDSPFSAGTNQLIADGAAKLTARLEDVLDALGEVGSVLRAEGAEEPPPPAVELSAVEAELLEQLTAVELSLDELVRRTGRPAAEVTAAMTTLAIKGVVARKPGGVFARRRPGRGASGGKEGPS